ncbi:glucokinase [Leptolyngbya sp. FACHB-711]|uniref:glucokinase n=1 Tax=unclassified Leptolyngbya TaxID=2650499 RepID=UPI0016863D21|nr:glucokinase [Leptolyngbya sp. FACHB-711]MBD1849190.1 glucokinase [Cyanobacteria bacterium FACHB-502]MBD2022855.1 glucokinase [Leptolyngbya sp. FACHB-711]
MTQILAGDTGGTKTLLYLMEAQPGSARTGVAFKTLYAERFTSREFDDLAPLVRRFFENATAAIGTKPNPQKACFSIAGPVVANTCTLTNLSWILSADRLQQDLSIAQIRLLNDFAAVGHGIEALAPDDILTLQTGEPDPAAPIAVIGAGTGLGQGFVIRQGSQYQVFGTEGGHADFAPRSEMEFLLLKYLRDKHELGRVSVERVVSGMGIAAIYQFLRDRQGSIESPDIAQAFRTWEQEAGKSEKSVDPGAMIGKAAAEKRDLLCQETMEFFVAAYGAEAGNLALKLLPYGGLYIAGGVAAKNLELMKSGIFLKAMCDKGRMRSLMERIPVHLILNEQVGLLGAALIAARL